MTCPRSAVLALALALALLAALAGASTAQAASLTVTSSLDPTEEEPVTVMASGSADSSQRLYVYWRSGTWACASTAYQESSNGGTLIIDQAVAAGAFNKQAPFTPGSAGSYRACSYLATDRFSTPTATATTTITARAPTATLSLDTSADPTEEEPVTVTASGDSEANRGLYVFWRSGTWDCASTAYQESSNGGTALRNGTALAAGQSFTDSSDFTPPATGSYRVCAYVAEDRFSTPNATATKTVSTRTPSASASLAVAADPTEDKTVSLTASGTTEAARSIWVLWRSGTWACASTAYQESSNGGTTIVNGQAASAGSTYSIPTSFTPPESGSYRLCAYVAEDRFSTPTATATSTVEARAPSASLSVTSSPGTARDGDRVTVTASGTLELSRKVTLLARLGTWDCAASAYQESSNGGRMLVNAAAQSAGTFSVSGTLDVTEGTYRICAYAGEDNFTSEAATGGQFTVRRRGANITIDVGPDPQLDRPVPISTRGSSEIAGKLFVYVKPGTAECASTAEQQSYAASALVTNAAIAVGDFNVAQSYTPTVLGPHRVCAYTASDAGTAPFGTATAVFNVRPDDALTPFLVAPLGDDDERDRLPLFIWRRDSDRSRDTLLIYDADPRRGGDVLGRVTTQKPKPSDPDDEDAPAPRPARDELASDIDRDDVDGTWKVRVLDDVAYGTFWWRVQRVHQATKAIVFSEPRRVRVVPGALKRLRLSSSRRNGNSSRRPGYTRLTVRSSPLSKVLVTVKRGGRTMARKRFTEGSDGQSALTFRWSCRRTGTFRYTVQATDPFGTTKTSRGRWTVSGARCAALRAREAARRQAAERRAAARRRASRPSGSGGGGGSTGGGGGSVGCDGDPNATPYPQRPGQRDADNDGCYGES